MNSENIMLSFIVPVYNVEDYIEECIQSILKINRKNIQYEILVINDGTKDNSINKIRCLFSDIPWLRIYEQQNSGLSVARNVGLSLAKGEYICFVDSDDYISATCLEHIFDSISGNEDIIIANFYNSYEEKLEKNESQIPNLLTETGVYFLEKYYLRDIYTVVWRNIYKRSFLEINKLFFYPGITYEDVEWMPRVIFSAKIIKYIDIPFYFYRKREDSIVNSSFSEKKMNDILTVANSLYSNSVNLEGKSKFVFHESAAYFIMLGISHLNKANGLTKQIEIETMELLSKLDGKSYKYNILQKLFKSIPTIFFSIIGYKFER